MRIKRSAQFRNSHPRHLNPRTLYHYTNQALSRTVRLAKVVLLSLSLREQLDSPPTSCAKLSPTLTTRGPSSIINFRIPQLSSTRIVSRMFVSCDRRNVPDIWEVKVAVSPSVPTRPEERSTQQRKTDIYTRTATLVGILRGYLWRGNLTNPSEHSWQHCSPLVCSVYEWLVVHKVTICTFIGPFVSPATALSFEMAPSTISCRPFLLRP